MGTISEFGNAETNRPTAVIAKVETEVIVEVVGLREFTVDDKFEVMSDATARDVDTTLVVKLCEEIRCGIDLIAIRERTGVQVAIDRRTNGVVRDDAAA